MKPLELARLYMDIVFDSPQMERLVDILADDLKFRGPFFQSDCADDYIRTMASDPPVGFRYKILQEYEDNSSACLIYSFEKPGISTTMAQVFQTKGNKISEILLVFDSAVFQTPGT
ncbi:MAG: hypothetical protein RIG77_18765 [Cyclobacteriaceae bacterium]